MYTYKKHHEWQKAFKNAHLCLPSIMLASEDIQ